MKIDNITGEQKNDSLFPIPQSPFPINSNSEWIIFWWMVGLFSAILIYLIWAPTYFPSQDGSSHLYNAWVMTELGNPDYPLINSSYSIRWALFPNWTGYAVMFSLMHIFSPITTEKIWLTLIILGLPFGVIVLARAVAAGIKNPRVPWWTLLGFFLVLNHPLYRGFQNHGMGLVLFVFILAYFWKNNLRGWTGCRILILNLLLLAAYFCHIVPFILSLTALIVLRLSRREKLKDNLRFLAGLIPMGLLLIYYRYSYPARYQLQTPGWIYLKLETVYLARGKMLSGFNYHEIWYISLMTLLGIGIISTLWNLLNEYRSSRRGERRYPLLILTLILLAIYLLSPDALGGGKYLNMRLALYPLFPLIIWLRTPRNMLLRICLICAIFILNLSHFEEKHSVQRQINKHYNRIVYLANTIPDHSFAATARFPSKGGEKLRPVLHTISYGIIGRDIVNLTNYEARLPYFPIRWKREPQLKWPIYSLTRTATDYTITPLDRREFSAEFFYSKILTNK